MTRTASRRGGARRTGAPVCGLLAITILVSGCETVKASPGLRYAAPSLDALAMEVLSAFAARDMTRLELLALTEDEFRGLVWPALPASRSAAGIPVAYAWSDLRTKSRGTLQETMTSLAGQRFDLLSVRFTGRVSDYGTFRVYRESLLDVRGSDGVTRRLRLFGSVIEHEGRVKVFSYVVD